jgi:hypothetical protein
MEALGPLFIGATIATIAGQVEAFVKKAWDGDIDGGARSLADGLANGAIELITWLTFKAGGAALRGVKALTKAGSRFRTALAAVKRTVGRLAARGAGFIVERASRASSSSITPGCAKWVRRCLSACVSGP